MTAVNSRLSTPYHSAEGSVRTEAAEANEKQSFTERLERGCADTMASYPIATAMAALAIGVTLGWLLKRR